MVLHGGRTGVVAPNTAGGSLVDRIRALSNAVAALETEVEVPERAGREIARRLRRGGTVYTLGMADRQHWQRT